MKTLAKTGMALAMALSLGACGTERGDRTLTGAVVGGTAGAIVGGVATGRAGGAVAGGLIGAAGGAIIGSATTPDRGYRRRCYRNEYGERYCE